MVAIQTLLTSLFRSILWLFQPNTICESVHDIDFIGLKEAGIRHILCDVDNTLLSYNEKIPSIQVLNLINRIQLMDLNIVLLSNNSNVKRIELVAQQLELPGVSFACKPFVFSARRVMHNFDMNVKNTAVIGDQVLTDVVLGNCLGVHTIAVDPISTEGCSYLKQLQYYIEAQLLKLSPNM